MKNAKRLLTMALLFAVAASGVLLGKSDRVLAAPSTIISGAEGSGTQSDPLIVDNFAELKAALQYNGTLYICVDEFATTTSDGGVYYYSLGNDDFYDNEPVISVIGFKYLELNTRVDIRNAMPARQVSTLMAVRGALTLTGSGTLSGGLSSANNNAVLYVESTGDLTCDGPGIMVKNLIATSANAICVNAGHCRINKGVIEGYTNTLYYTNPNYIYFGNALQVNGGTVELNGGIYNVNHEGDRDYSLSIRDTASVKIEGGTYDGILSTSDSKKIATYLGEGYSLYLNTTGEAVSADTKSIQNKVVQVSKYSPVISSVNVNVTVPIDGQHPAVPVAETPGLKITAYEWYYSDAKMNEASVFEAGEQYKLHVVVNPEDGFRLNGSSYAGHVTFNSDIAGTVYYEGGDFVNYYYIFTAVQPSVQTITFNANGGTVDVTTATTGSNGKLASLPVPVRANYHFSGWYTKATGGVKVDANYIFTSNLTIYARWKDLVYYTVAFNTNGGSSVADKQVEVDTKVDKPADPTRSSDKDYDYTFAGWFADSGLTTAFDFDTLIDSDTVIYAKWDKKAKATTVEQPGQQSDPDASVVAKVSAPGNVTLSKPKNNKKKTATISWKKIKADGYEVQIALKKNFRKGMKVKTTTGTSVKFKKLKKGKTYYVRVRAYNLDGKKKVFSKKWSTVKKIKIRK